MTATTLHDKAKNAAAKFFERKGYELLERDFGGAKRGIAIVAKDGDCIVFADVHESTGELPEENLDGDYRKRAESLAIKFFAKHHEFANVPVRFDVVSLAVVGNDRAPIRHHISAFNM